LVVVTALLLASACGPTPPQPPAASSETETLPTATPMQTNTPQLLPTELPPSTRLGAVLTSSGAVNRSLLTYDDLMTGASTGPLDDGAFALPEAAAMPAVVFKGRLELVGEANYGA